MVEKSDKSESVLVVGFNTRPLVYSLYQAGYKVYAVDFFGDKDLFPYIIDSIIVVNELEKGYKDIKENYGYYLVKFSIDMLKKYPNINYLIIGSGLDDNFKGREEILRIILKKDYNIQDLNNPLPVIMKARNLSFVYDLLTLHNYWFPKALPKESLGKYFEASFEPYILKKKIGSGGVNVFKITNQPDLTQWVRIQETKGVINTSDWILQEYIEGIPVSCTVISNGTDCQVISVNKQLIGVDFLNTPLKFMYCGNVVPSKLNQDEIKLISEISITLTKELGLKGINGFDFVLKDKFPYFMEINPRIPGSIRCSEEALNLNLLDLHIKSFDPMKWDIIRTKIENSAPDGFVTKFIVFADNEIDQGIIKEINKLAHIHDKTKPDRTITKGEPICSILYKARTYSESYSGALKIVEKIKELINKK